MTDAILGILMVTVVFSSFTLIMLIFGQNTFGAGDVKMFLAIATIWGWKVVSISIYFSFLCGGIVGAYLILFKSEKNRLRSICTCNYCGPDFSTYLYR